jgi:hypothetical protein
MANSEDRLRDLIRLIPPARALFERLEKSVDFERYAGVGDPAVKLYQGLYSTITGLTTDPYLTTLALNLPDDATDEQKTLFVHMATIQLLAFLEAQIGGVGIGAQSERRIQMAPKVAFQGPVNNIASETLLKILSEEEAPVEGAAEPEE